MTSLLGKKIIKKENLYQYLHENRVQIDENFTKVILIEKTVHLWKEKFDLQQPPPQSTENNNQINVNDNTENYPINIMSKKFSSWFYENLNSNKLTENDFWKDAGCCMRLQNLDQIEENTITGGNEVQNLILGLKNRFSIFFNPNLCHEGVQGRIDPHGLVIVLSCGTIHTENACLGTFESSFGLLRDPFADNNWKIKYLKFLIKYASVHNLPRLTESESLQEFVSLPLTDGSIE